MKRIERELYFPPEVVAMFREAERKRRKPLINWWAVLGMSLVLVSATLIIYGFAKVLDTL